MMRKEDVYEGVIRSRAKQLSLRSFIIGSVHRGKMKE